MRVLRVYRPPMVYIESPVATGETYVTSNQDVTVSGQASGVAPLVEVRYQLSGATVGSNICSGLETWSTGSLSYNVGITTVTIIAEDNIRLKKAKSITVERTDGGNRFIDDEGHFLVDDDGRYLTWE